VAVVNGFKEGSEEYRELTSILTNLHLNSILSLQPPRGSDEKVVQGCKEALKVIKSNEIQKL
jgi:hypothetical protein